MTYTLAAYPTSHYQTAVPAAEARYTHHEPMEMRTLSDWSDGTITIFEH